MTFQVSSACPGVQTEEISFLEGVMRFLGVEVLAAMASPSKLSLRADT
ncbi:hypothetical protein ACRAWD_31615 [Caulobacter segnis]